MSTHIEELAALVEAQLGERVRRYAAPPGELAYELAAPQLLEVALILRDGPGLAFESLIDVAGVDFLDYGRADWNTSTATSTAVGTETSAPGTPPTAEPSSKATRIPRPGRPTLFLMMRGVRYEFSTCR